ncbi:NAD-P-binding protein [Rhizoctonia solani]|uniref:NAD-P-binding protein n=1 Tax=Rhizoctonia solani TaxID=456999 RepID=A0A8H7IBP8_9AGAM|nr:NAD-P-binding protein [Rhizoctonia solani]
MLFIQPPAKILLTGANGYYAVHVIKDLLDHGYEVVGTHAEKFSYTVVPDIVKAGAFNQVIEQGGFDAVAHAASPVVIPGGTVEDFVKPAIDGTVGILDSIKSYGYCQCIPLKDVVHNETHWNESIIKHVEEQGEKAASIMIYIYSKTLAEKAIWKWWSENKQGVSWDLATINPSFVNDWSTHKRCFLPRSTNIHQRGSLLHPCPHTDLSERAWPVTHVRDVAAIHSALFERAEDVSGRRVIVVGSEPSWQDMYDALAQFSGVPKGVPGVGTNPDTGSPSWDTTYARELLGKEFIGTKDMFIETEEYYRQKGWSYFV